MKKLLTFLLPLLSVLLLAVTAEAALRFYHLIRWDISFVDGGAKTKGSGGPSPISVDPELGWRATEMYRFDGEKLSSDGARYAAKISQNENGFRMFGDLSSGRPRVFVIGDSFTQAVDSSDDQTYYAILKQVLNLEVFAYGGGGYGSLQEFMVLDKYFDLIKPDLVLWQYSTNDFVNNSPEMETASSINNNGVLRPYWINGHVLYILPKAQENLRAFALQYCRVCYMILNRADRLRASTTRTVETETSPGEKSHQVFLKSVQTTDEIMGKVRNRAGSVPIAAFIVGTGEPYGPEYEEGLAEISRHHAIVLLEGVEAAVLNAEKNGTVVRGEDGVHWNEPGNSIAGHSIAESLRKTCLLNLC